jgi:hypothetical protein
MEFAVYSIFPFNCNFQFKSQNKISLVLERFLGLVRVDLAINSLLPFLVIFPIFSLILCLP